METRLLESQARGNQANRLICSCRPHTCVKLLAVLGLVDIAVKIACAVPLLRKLRHTAQSTGTPAAWHDYKIIFAILAMDVIARFCFIGGLVAGSVRENLCWLVTMMLTVAAALAAPIVLLVDHFSTLGLASCGLSVVVTVVALYIIARRIQEIRVTRKYERVDNAVSFTF